MALIDLNDALPAPPAGKTNIKWQADPPGTTPREVSAYMPLLVGDGVGSPPTSGGVSGAVPAPAIGDAAAGKFLKADATWAVPPGSGGTVIHTGPLTAGQLLKGNGGADIEVGDLTGDVTTSGGTATTLANIPNDTPVAGDLLATAVAAPATPAAGKGRVYVDSTSKNLAVKDDAGVVKHGVQTKAAVANQFLTGINDAGLPSAAQPAFTDISGSVAASQLPNPSASTLGGIESIAAVGHKWIDSISTSGVPHLSQPDFSDLTGTQPYDVVCSLPGKPGASALVLLLTFTRAVTFAGNFAGSAGTVGTNPAATAVYTVNKNGSSIGTISISTGGVFTFSTTAGATESFASGDRMTITAPSSQDTTLADVAITLAGTR